jgi:hypothetical protein
VTYEDKAQVIAKELEAGTPLADALRIADLRSSCRGKLGPAERLAIRRRRMAREKLAAIAYDFGVSEGTVARHCAGIPRPRIEPSRHGMLALAITADRCGLPRGSVERRPGPGKPPPAIIRARRIAMLAMRQLGASISEIAFVMRRRGPQVKEALAAAAADAEVVATATDIAAEAMLSLSGREEHAA